MSSTTSNPFDRQRSPTNSTTYPSRPEQQQYEPVTPRQDVNGHPQLQQQPSPRAASHEANNIDNNGGSTVPRYKLKATLLGHKKGLSAVKISPDNAWVATSSADGRILVYSLVDFTFYRCFEHNTLGNGGINDIAWGPNSQQIASASDDKTVKLFDLPSGKLERVFHGHTAYVFCLAFNPQGSLLISGAFDETLKLWDVTNGACIRTIPAHSDPISAVDVNSDGTMIATSSHDGLVQGIPPVARRLWDILSGQCIKSISDDTNPPVSNVRFTPNGKLLLAGSLDSVIRLWSPITEKTVKTYVGHTNAKYDMTAAFVQRPDCNYVASGSEDGRLYLWDVQSRKVVRNWQAHMDAVIGVCVGGERGQYLISAGLEKDLVAKVWVDMSVEEGMP